MSVVMDTLDAGSRHRDALPSIGHLELDRVKKDGVDFTPRYPPAVSLGVSSAPLVSPTTIYPGPLPAYSFPSSTTVSAPALSGYISPPDSRRTAEDDREKDSSSSHRQSLPSIKEALGTDKALSFSSAVAPVPAPPHSSFAPQNTQVPSSSATPRSHADAPAGPPNPFSHAQGPITLLRENPYGSRPSQPHTAVSGQAETSPRTTQAAHMDTRPPQLHTLNHAKSPSQQPRPTAPAIQTSQPGPAAYDYPNSASSMPSINGYSSYQAPYPYPSAPATAHPSSYQPPPYEARSFAPDWKSGGPDAMRHDDGKKPIARMGGSIGSYGDSVKRHLEVFDIEASLNDISEGTRKLTDFSHHYRMKSHQTQRSGPVPGSMPSLPELESMVRDSARISDALARIRDVIITQQQQHALAEQRAQSQAFKPESHFDEDGGIYQDDFKGGAGGFAGADAKKRRGQKAAPPGRCHSCNRAETPEWRRGPDGARTLCNACGLHYAKLTRKLGPKATLPGTNLRPKNNIDPRSPQQ